MVTNAIPRQHRHALLALLLGINLGHWMPDLVTEPELRVQVVSRRVARMVAAFGGWTECDFLHA